MRLYEFFKIFRDASQKIFVSPGRGSKIFRDMILFSRSFATRESRHVVKASRKIMASDLVRRERS